MKKAGPSFNVFSEHSQSGVALKNRSLKREIVRHIDTNGVCTITEVSKELNISVPKVTSLMNELIANGLVQDEGKLDSTGGRRASIYGLVSNACYFVGVDVKRHHINFGLMDFNKNIISRNDKSAFLLENNQQSLDNLLAEIENFLADCPVERHKILGIGLNLGGRIDHNTGHNFNHFNFIDTPLTALIKNEKGIPAFLENDSRAMALGELHSGIVSNEKDIIFMNLDYGIGTAIFIDGKLYYGKSGFSGELGHIPMFDNEVLCPCGKSGPTGASSVPARAHS